MNGSKKVSWVLSIHMGHDSSCCLVRDGKIVASVAEERFTRTKHYSFFPTRSVKYCLEAGKVGINDIDLIVNPEIARPSEMNVFLHLKNQPLFYSNSIDQENNFFYFIRYFAIQLLRLFNKTTSSELPAYVKGLNASENEIIDIEHHMAHAASAYYSSGFSEKTLVITSDGSGDGLSTTVWLGEVGKLTELYKVGRGGSLGAFYGTVTEALDWQVSDGEGKVMGLAPYGDDRKLRGKLDFICPRYKEGKLIKSYDWGWPGLWNDEGAVHWHFKKTGDVLKLVKKYGKENVAAEAQRILERELLEIVKFWQKETGAKYLATSGGVFLNVKANQKIIESEIFDDVYIYPDAGDAGITAGAALYGYYLKNPEEKIHNIDSIYWGPEYSDSEIKKALDVQQIKYEKLSEGELIVKVSRLLADGKIVGWFQGRMEAGPRALGNRSILMDPRKAENKDIINSTVKYREPFRPFCPSLIEEAAGDYFEKSRKAPFMIVSFNVKKEAKGKIPAVTHVDGTARPQTVTKKQNKRYYLLIKEFGKRTGVPVVLNTSFNVKGEPIVCTPQDAIRCFYGTGMEYLALGDFLIKK